MGKKMKKTMDRAKRICVRFNDNQGCDTKFYKTGLPSELEKEMYHFGVKFAEQLAWGFSPNSEKFQKKFPKFQRVSQRLKLKALPEGYQSFPPKEKGKAVKKLVAELVAELAAAMSHGPVQGVDTQADYPDDLQMSEGSGPDPASEGVANTSVPPDDSSLQNVPPGSVRSEGPPLVPPGFIFDLKSNTLNQPDNPEKFRKVSDGLKLEALPEGYQSFSHYTEKRETVEKLVDESGDLLAAALGHGPVQADDSDNMQVGAGNARQFDKTVREGVDMQVKNPDPGGIQVDEVLAAAPNPDSGSTLSNVISLQNVTAYQCDNSQGESPSRPPFPLEGIVFYLNDLMLRASRFPGIFPKFEWTEASFRSFVIKLESLEGVLTDDSTTNSISHQMELYPSLEDSSAYEAVTSMPSMEESLENEIWGYLVLPRPEAPGTSPNLYAG